MACLKTAYSRWDGGWLNMHDLFIPSGVLSRKSSSLARCTISVWPKSGFGWHSNFFVLFLNLKNWNSLVLLRGVFRSSHFFLAFSVVFGASSTLPTSVQVFFWGQTFGSDWQAITLAMNRSGPLISLNILNPTFYYCKNSPNWWMLCCRK